jgi:hypothetical protein
VAKSFRANSATRGTSLIVLPGKEGPAAKARAFVPGANDYPVTLPGPVEPAARARCRPRAYLSMGRAMQQLVESTGSTSSELATIREKADNITQVVTTTTQVADQTNLLSTNAASEAEKAGEHGRGFRVVAREIRRLAGQTAVATLDIGSMVRLTQDAVPAGVLQTDQFGDEVRPGHLPRRRAARRPQGGGKPQRAVAAAVGTQPAARGQRLGGAGAGRAAPWPGRTGAQIACPGRQGLLQHREQKRRPELPLVRG